MSNIRVDLSIPIYDGHPVTFRSPADCSQVTGLIIYYPDGETTTSKVFQFADAHGNNVGNLDLFAANVVVKVILDTDTNLAFVQNADTNAYLEARFEELENKASNIVVTEDDDPEDVDFWIDEDDDSTVEDAHINNMNNPHKVTIAQVGGVNPNLLDNWYFADPIDQRGGYFIPAGTSVYTDSELNVSAGLSSKSYIVTSITDSYVTFVNADGDIRYASTSAAVRGYTGGNYAYSIDRWKAYTLDVPLKLVDGGIEIEQTSGNFVIEQLWEPSLIIGQKYTVSYLTNRGLHKHTFTFNGAQVSSGRVLFFSSGKGMQLWFATSSQTGVILTAAKLELGTEQTLAHQDENGNWVLNEIPNKAEQLLRCSQSIADSSDTYANGKTGFAPAGYGLGGTINENGADIPLNESGVRDFNKAINTGWYWIYDMGNEYVNAPPDEGGTDICFMRVETYRYSLQTVYCTNTRGDALALPRIWMRKSADRDYNTWGAWQCVSHTYGTTDLTAGISPLANGQLHFVYE